MVDEPTTGQFPTMADVGGKDPRQRAAKWAKLGGKFETFGGCEAEEGGE